MNLKEKFLNFLGKLPFIKQISSIPKLNPPIFPLDSPQNTLVDSSLDMKLDIPLDDIPMDSPLDMELDIPLDDIPMNSPLDMKLDIPLDSPINTPSSEINNYEERRKKFLKEVSFNSTQPKENWKEPDLDSIYYYKNNKLPINFLNDMHNSNSFNYLGENCYSFDIENLTLEQNYNLVKILCDRISDDAAVLVESTQKSEDFQKNFSIYYNQQMCIANNDYCDPQKQEHALSILENLLTYSLNYYNNIMKDDPIIKEAYSDIDFSLGLDN